MKNAHHLQILDWIHFAMPSQPNTDFGAGICRPREQNEETRLIIKFYVGNLELAFLPVERKIPHPDYGK